MQVLNTYLQPKIEYDPGNVLGYSNNQPGLQAPGSGADGTWASPPAAGAPGTAAGPAAATSGAVQPQAPAAPSLNQEQHPPLPLSEGGSVDGVGVALRFTDAIRGTQCATQSSPLPASPVLPLSASCTLCLVPHAQGSDMAIAEAAARQCRCRCPVHSGPWAREQSGLTPHLLAASFVNPSFA